MSGTATTTTTTVSPTSGELVNRAIARLAALLDRRREERGLSPGDLAELRRMDPVGGTLPPAFWRLVVEPELAAAIRTLDKRSPENVERAVGIVIQAMVEVGVAHNKRIGEVLAESGYAEARFVRFLRARGRDVATEARQAASFCAAKGASFRFADQYRGDGFACFVLFAFLEAENEAARRTHAIARDYFRTLAFADRNDSNERD